MFNYNTDRYTQKEKELLSDILMDFVTDGLADYIDDYEDEEEDKVEEPKRNYTYEDYMADAKHYLDKAYEYLGVSKKVPQNESVQPRYDKTEYKSERKPEYKPEYKPEHKPKAACSCGNACKCKSEKTSILPKITRVIFNNPDTTVFFDDGTISHVKTVKGDKFDKEHGILYAVFKRLYGSHGNRIGMRGLMPGAGAARLLQNLVENADDLTVKPAKKSKKIFPFHGL
jgi:hypothetical protein